MSGSRAQQVAKRDNHNLSTSSIFRQSRTFSKNKVISESCESSQDDIHLPPLSPHLEVYSIRLITLQKTLK